MPIVSDSLAAHEASHAYAILATSGVREVEIHNTGSAIEVRHERRADEDFGVNGEVVTLLAGALGERIVEGWADDNIVDGIRSDWTGVMTPVAKHDKDIVSVFAQVGLDWNAIAEAVAKLLPGLRKYLAQKDDMRELRFAMQALAYGHSFALKMTVRETMV